MTTPSCSFEEATMGGEQLPACNTEEEKPKEENGENSQKTLKFCLPVEKIVLPLMSTEPPAGLTFTHLKPMLIGGMDNGYELKKPATMTVAIYQNDEVTRKLRMARSHLIRSKPYVTLRSVCRKYLERSLDSLSSRSSEQWGVLIKQRLEMHRLHRAVSTNDCHRVREALLAGVDPNIHDEQLRTALHLAACRGYTNIVKILLAHGANPNAKDTLGNTPLHLAACTNNVAVVTLLLSAGTDVSSLDYFGRSPLQLAQTKLKLLQKYNSVDAQILKQEVQQVTEMMKQYLQKKGQDVEAELLEAFSTRLTLSNTAEQVSSGVQDLLDSLANLDLSKKESPVNTAAT